MQTRGMRLLDPALDTVQIDWLVVSVDECRDDYDEQRLIGCHFRKPHEAWGPSRAFVMPVRVRRNRSRVLFSQQSGLE